MFTRIIIGIILIRNQLICILKTIVLI